MPQNKDAMKLAVLIDGENVSHDLAEQLFAQVSDIGDACIRRVYGDFSGGRLSGWSEKLKAHGVVARHQPEIVKGKNSADIALVIDAMDLLLQSGTWLDGFCIVSSDSDFAQLASQIREEGRNVFGFGSDKTPTGFRSACKSFHVLSRKAHKAKVSVPATLPIAIALPCLRKAVEQCVEDDGWAEFAKVATFMSRNFPELKHKQFAVGKLSNLFVRAGEFEILAAGAGPMRIKLSRQTNAA